MITEKQWELVKKMLSSGMRPVDIAKKCQFVTARQIYSKKRQWEKEEYYTDPKNIKYHTKKYKAWRLAVFQSDGFKCRWCGAKRGLQADHILPQSTHPHLMFKVSNGRTLCRTCHQRTVTFGKKALNYKRQK